MDTSPSAPNAAPAAIVADLKGTRPWVLVVTVAGYLLTGLCLLVALVALLFPAMIPRDKETPGGPGVFSLIYLFVAAIYLTFTILLHGYARAIRIVSADRDLGSVERALAAQRRYWRAVGILVLAVFCIMLLTIVIGIVVGLAAGRGGTAA
jgi:hypothetical protein